MDYSSLMNQSIDVLRSEPQGTALQRLCDFLKQAVPHYDWFGFYIAVPEERVLVLGPFAGENTDHVRISYGQGICGQAAAREETFLVGDVAAQSNYLSCSIHVKSEIVVPILRDGQVLGEIDVDSHTRDAFTRDDRGFLEALAPHIAPLLPDLAGPVRTEPS